MNSVLFWANFCLVDVVKISLRLLGSGAAGAFVAAGAFILLLPQVFMKTAQFPSFHIIKKPGGYIGCISVYLDFGSK